MPADLSVVRDDQGEPVLAPVYVSPREAARILGLSRSQVYRLLDEGQIDSCRQGTRRLVSVPSLMEFTQLLTA
jgi:excisionase family DNA binding protein